MKCEGCGDDAEVECADCAPKGADSEPLLLCQQCCSRIHIGHGRLSKHRVVSLAYKKQGLELRAKLEKHQIKAGQLIIRKSQIKSCRDDIDEKVKIYERQIRETTLAVCQKIKQRAIGLIKKMKEAASSRASGMDAYDKYLHNAIFSKMAQINKDMDALEKSSVEDYQEKIKAIEEQMEGLDFSHLREHLPSTSLYYTIDFDGVQKDIKALDFELLDPQPPETEAENVTDTPKYLRDSIEEGCELKVCIQTAVSKCGDFWLQPDFPSDVYEKLIDISHKTRREYICDLDWKAFEPEDEGFETEALCCVLYPSDNKWYRGCIEELRSDRKSATVRYLDFGNTSMVSVSQILPYRCFVPGVPFQAIECRLAGLDELLSHDAKWTFNDLVRDSLLDCKFLEKVEDDFSSSTLWLVELKLTQQDQTVLDLNQMVKERVVNKTQKEAIACRDVRLSDGNLPRNFKVISTTVKPGDSVSLAEGAASGGDATGDESADQSDNSEQNEKKDGEEAQEPKDDKTKYSSQDIRNVVHTSQDIRSASSRSQDIRKSKGKSQDVRKQAPSQDIRTPDIQDGRHSNSGGQEQVDDCSSFLSSIGLGVQDSSDGKKSKGGKSRRKAKASSKSHVQETPAAAVRDFVIQQAVSRMQDVAEVEAESRIVVSSVAVSPGGHERQGTWIPSGQSYQTALKPPKGKSASVLSALKPPPGGSYLEAEAQAVVTSIIQEVVSSFCFDGQLGDSEPGADSEEVQPISHFSEELAYDLESRGSDEHSSETIVASEPPETANVEAESEETGVKSLLLEEGPRSTLDEVKPRPYTKSISGSTEDINVKDSVLKPEIQDKSLGNLCGYDVEQTAVKIVQEDPVAEEELGDPDQAQLLSISTNEIESQLDSIEPLSDQLISIEEKSQSSLRPEEDLTCSLSSTGLETPGIYSRLPRIMFVQGSTFDLFVVDGIQKNGTFCGQIARTEEEESLFSQFSEELRNHALQCNDVALVREGALVLAPFENSWYRAEILKLNADQSVQVGFVDFGNSDTVSLSRLKPLPRHLLYVQHQTTQCRLVSYCLTSQFLTDQELTVFNKIVQDKKLRATVVAFGKSCLQVNLALTLETGQMKDVAAIMVEQCDTSVRSGDRRISILSRHAHPPLLPSPPPPLSRGILPFPPMPYQFADFASAVQSFMYHQQCAPNGGHQTLASNHEYAPRRGVTIETFPPRDPQVPGSSQQHGYPSDMTSYGRPRSCSPNPTPTEGEPLLRSPTPTHLREDAAPFHPGSVYISPLKTEESLDQHIKRGRSARGKGDMLSAGDTGHTDWPSGREPMLSEPHSLISEPSSVTASTVFDEDAWCEFENSKWPSSESLPSTKPSYSNSNNSSSSSQRPPHKRPSNRRNQRRGSRENKEGYKSGHRSDGSDRGDRACFNCNKVGHFRNQCPFPERNNSNRQSWERSRRN